MLSPKNILSINNWEAQVHKKDTVTNKMLRVLSLGEKKKGLEPECTISYQEYLRISFFFFFNTLYLGAKQGSIWTSKKGTSLKIIHHSVVEWSQS